MKLPDFEGWAVFASVVEHRSFSAAAAALGLSKATVSKAITRLETRLGTALFHRTSRKITLTDSGRALADRARALLAEGLAAEESARDQASAPAGLVRIAAPQTFGARHVAPAIADLLAAYPEIEVELHLSDARTDIVAEGIDIALRIADLPDSSLRARRLMPISTCVVAAPAYLAAHGRPRHPADLAAHQCFVYTNVGTAAWQFTGPDGESASVRPEARFSTNSGDAMLPALRAGLGIARLPDFIIGEDLAAGTLEALLPGWQAPPIALHLLTPPATLRPQRVEVAIDFLTERFRSPRVGRA